jgi:hypothetical protein
MPGCWDDTAHGSGNGFRTARNCTGVDKPFRGGRQVTIAATASTSTICISRLMR